MHRLGVLTSPSNSGECRADRRSVVAREGPPRRPPWRALVPSADNGRMDQPLYERTRWHVQDELRRIARWMRSTTLTRSDPRRSAATRTICRSPSTRTRESSAVMRSRGWREADSRGRSRPCSLAGTAGTYSERSVTHSATSFRRNTASVPRCASATSKWVRGSSARGLTNG